MTSLSPPSLKITEIFHSLQGEARTVGLPTVFVRLTGCPLRCRYCDTEYAFTGGSRMSFAEIHQQIEQYSPRYVTVTGGEPLAQKHCLELLTQLSDKGYEVSLETSGSIDISKVDQRVSRVVDIKTPGSGEVSRNLLSNLQYLTSHDQVKFVICHEDDYFWSKDFITQHQLVDKCELLFSPSHGEIDATSLADWIVRDNLPVRFQLQLHKLLWKDEPGR